MTEERYIVDPYDTRGRALTSGHVFTGLALLELHRDAVARARVLRDGTSLGERWILIVEDAGELAAYEYTLGLGTLRERTIEPPLCICGGAHGEGAEYEAPALEAGDPGGWDGCERCIAHAQRAAEEARTDMAVEALLEREREVA